VLTGTGDGVRTALRRTADADRRLRTLLQPLDTSGKNLAVFATGGYGRCDLSPYSDLDLIILLRGDPEPHEEAIRRLVQGLWDAGLHPGQTVLHLDDIDHDLLAIPDRAATLLEVRTLWGEEELLEEFARLLNTRFTANSWATFVSVKQEEFDARRARYGKVTRVVEPHLKAQAGGLRDMHHVFWLERARTALEGRWTPTRRCGSEIASFLGRMRAAGQLTVEESTRLFEAYDLLLRLRDTLRTLKREAEDKLLVMDQPAVSRMLGYRGTDREVMRDLMRAVFESNERISRFAVEFGAFLAEHSLHSKPLHAPIEGLEGISQSNGRLELSQGALERVARSPEQLVALVDTSVRMELPLSGRSRHDLRRLLALGTGPCAEPAEWGKAIAPWFRLQKGFARRLRVLDELDVIGRFLPEWLEIVGLTTGSYYHSYTVDEHTLMALERLDNLPDDGPEGLPAAVWHSLEERAILYLALIFHDIAKGRVEGEHHSVEGARLVEGALFRLGWQEWTEPVAKLVLHHLRMEQVAFRRDFKDPAVLQEFAEQIENPGQLAWLYLLTICDLSAVNPRVWTAWKGRLLAELYLETRSWFERGAQPEEATVALGLARVAPLIADDIASSDMVLDFLASMREEYRRAVPAEEIASHVRAAASLRSGTPFHWQIDARQGFIILTLITRDRVGLLAQITGLLVTQGIGIREARIFTRKDGIIVDRFRAEDIERNGTPLDERLNRIPQLWKQLSEGTLLIDELLARFQRRRRLDRSPAALVEAEISATPSPSGILIDVAGPDSMGLLYRLCSIFAERGYDVRAARVSRRLDGVMDNFVVHDPGGRLETAEGRADLIRRIREAIDAAA